MRYALPLTIWGLLIAPMVAQEVSGQLPETPQPSAADQFLPGEPDQAGDTSQPQADTFDRDQPLDDRQPLDDDQPFSAEQSVIGEQPRNSVNAESRTRMERQRRADVAQDDHRQGTNTQANNRWRYKRHNGEWWYWTSDNSWVYWRNSRWNPYDPASFQLPGTRYVERRYVQEGARPYVEDNRYYSTPTRRYSTGYRGPYGDGFYQGGRRYYGGGYDGYGRYDDYGRGFYDGRNRGGYGGRYYRDPGYRQGVNIGGAIGGAVGGREGAGVGAAIGGAIGRDN
jgi:hypothetical protein